MCICYINKDLIDNDLEIIVINFKGFKKKGSLICNLKIKKESIIFVFVFVYFILICI